MPPAKPVKRRATKSARNGDKPKATCHTCGKRISIPQEWSLGAAVRRHYWAKHRDVMQPRRSESGR